MTITRRIALASAGAVAIAVVVMAAVSFYFASAQFMSEIDASLTDRVTAYAELSSLEIPDRGGSRSPLLGLTSQLPRRAEADFDTTYIQVVTERGTINIGEDQLALPLIEGPVPLNTVTYRSEWVDGVHLRIAATAIEDPRRVVQVGRPLGEIDEALSGLALLLTVGGALGVVVAAGLGYIVAKSAVRPIGTLEGEITDIAHTQSFGRRIGITGTDEVAQLAAAFNELLAELEASRAEQTRLVRDAGHELRTPLTALRTNLEILQRHEVPADERGRMLAAAHAEVEELSLLVAEVVDLATDRYTEEEPTAFALREVVEDVAERVQRRSGRDVIVESDASTVVAKRGAITRAVSNIVANADKWAPVETPITVSVHDGRIEVADRGPGIAAGDLDRVFDRFYRSAAARSTPGSGLGLSIVDQIVTNHGGAVFANNGPDGGAVVGFDLPVAEHDFEDSPAS